MDLFIRISFLAIPASEAYGPLRLIVHTGPKRNDPLNDLGPQKRHTSADPPALTRAQHKRLLDSQRLENLEVHVSSVPIRPLQRLGTRRSMPEKLDGKEVDLGGELFVLELQLVEIGRGCEGVYEDEGGFGRVVRFGHLVGRVDATEVGDADGFLVGVGHCCLLMAGAE
jgi:hypothetical protein